MRVDSNGWPYHSTYIGKTEGGIMLNTKKYKGRKILLRNAMEVHSAKGITMGGKLLLIAILIAIMCVLMAYRGCSLANASIIIAISTENATRAIVGEGESETYLGKLALASTLYLRGTLKGVCAYKNVIVKDGHYFKRVSLKSKYYARTHHKLREIPIDQVNEAKLAWEYILKNGVNKWQATGWGTKEDISIFKKEGWFSRCIIVDHIGKHYFYK